MNGDLKQTFIIQAVTEYHERVKAQMQLKFGKMKIGVTNDAYNSIAYNVSQQGNGVTSNLSFKEYLRFVDMGVGRSHPLGGLRTMQVSLKASNRKGDVFVKDRVRKPKKVYSKTSYGNLNWLIGKLLYGYTEETKTMIEKELQYQKIN